MQQKENGKEINIHTTKAELGGIIGLINNYVMDIEDRLNDEQREKYRTLQAYKALVQKLEAQQKEVEA